MNRVNEDFINYLWINKLINKDVKTTSGEEVKIITPGILNTDSGPDFFNAMIEIDGTKWAGNIEVHVNSLDWFKHKHQNDPAYDSIILHVVYNNDKEIERENLQKIPTIELKDNFNSSILSKYQYFITSKSKITCSNLIGNITYFDKLSWFDRLMAERLEQKGNEIISLLDLTLGNFSQIFYLQLSKALGYTANSQAMEMLAKSIPLNIISKHSNNIMQIEALLYGQSGLLPPNTTDGYIHKLQIEYNFLKAKYQLIPMDGTLWKFMRMRPASFPTIRISQLANIIYNSSGLLNKIIEAEKITDVIGLLSVSASSYWDNHYQFAKIAPGKSKKLGITTINIIMINTIIPMMFIYGKSKNNLSLQQKALDWLSKIKPEANSITREFGSMGIVAENAMQSQALIQLKNYYCIKKQCLACRFGQLLLQT